MIKSKKEESNMGMFSRTKSNSYFSGEEQFLRKLSDYFRAYASNVGTVLTDKNAALEKAKAETIAYGEKLIKENLTIFKNYKKSIETFLLSLENTKYLPSHFNIQYTPESFNDISQAVSELNVRFQKLSELLKEFNNYQFSDSSLDFQFDGEKAVVNGVEYQAPDFPELKESDFDTDKNYKDLIKNVYLAAYAVLSCLDYAIAYFSSDKYKKVVEGIELSIQKQVRDQLDKETEEKLAEYKDNAAEYYKNTCFPILDNNAKKMVDFQTLDSLEMPNVFKETLNLGYCELKVPEFSSFESVIRDFDTKKVIKEKIKFPVTLDLKKKGNIFINYSADEQPAGDMNLADFIHQVILQFISSAPYKKVSLALVDLDSFDEFNFVKNFSSKPYLADNNLIFNKEVATDESSFKALLDNLAAKINQVQGQKLGRKNCDNVFQYNALSPETSQELHLLVYVDCPKKMNADCAEQISNLIVNGNECGIFSIIVNDESERLSSESYEYNETMHANFLNRIRDQSVVFEYRSRERKFVFEDLTFTPHYCFKTNDVNPFFEKLSKGAAEAASNNIVYLDSILNKDFPRGDFAKELTFPVGKDGGDLVSFKLTIEGTGTSSAILAGGTGSGKSSFLHALILSGSYYYSPEELEFYLIDFKDGVEFSPYYDAVNRTSIIPHVTFLSLRNRVEDAYDIFNKIDNEKEYRNRCFKKANVKLFTDYAKHPLVTSGKLPRFKRKVIIIDEYHEFLTSEDTATSILCGKCAGKLLSLLKEIRNVGISLVLASQSIDVDRDSLEQIFNRYIMSSSGSTLQRAFPDFSGDDMNTELSLEKGLVYRTENGGHKKQLFKAAYTGKNTDPHFIKLIDAINDKWKAEPTRPVVSGSQDPLMIYASDAPFATFTNIYSEEDIEVKAFFGQSSLSNDLVNVTFSDSDTCSFVLIGGLKKTRPIEVSLGLSFLYSLKCMEYEVDSHCVHYLELSDNETSLKFPSLFKTYREELSSCVTYAHTFEEIADSINSLYDEFLQRKEASRQRRNEIKIPRLLIINSFLYLESISDDYSNMETKEDDVDYGISNDMDDELAAMASGGVSSGGYYDDDLSLYDKVKILYQNGFSYKIFVIIQDSKAGNINKRDDIANLSRAICTDEKEIEFCSDVPIQELPENCAVLFFPEISKVRPFMYDKTDETKKYINKLVEELNK